MNKKIHNGRYNCVLCHVVRFDRPEHACDDCKFFAPEQIARAKAIADAKRKESLMQFKIIMP